MGVVDVEVVLAVVESLQEFGGCYIMLNAVFDVEVASIPKIIRQTESLLMVKIVFRWTKVHLLRTSFHRKRRLYQP